MKVEATLAIRGTRAATWAALTDNEHAASILSGVEKIEIVDRPASGLVGLRWRETRRLFGDSATVEKWIAAATNGESFETRAEDGGFVFVTTTRIAAHAGGVTVTSAHDSRPQTFAAKLKTIPMSLFFRGMIRKFILQDLSDIKTAVERSSQP